MGFRGVRTGDEKNITVNDFGGGVAHRRSAESHLKRNHRPRMAQASAVIDVVGAKKRAEKLLQEIVVFVGCLGAAVYRHGIGAVALENLDESAGGIIEGLVPGDLAPLIAIKGLCTGTGRLNVFGDGRRRYPVLIVNEVVAKTSLDA